MSTIYRYSQHYIDRIKNVIERHPNALCVIVADCAHLNLGALAELLADRATFCSTGGDSIFSKEWCKKLFKRLSADEDGIRILSYAQFYYLTSYFSYELLADDIIFIRDNLRTLFPLEEGDFIRDTMEDDNNDADLPIYQADQVTFNGLHYYTLKPLEFEVGTFLNVFQDEESLGASLGVDSDVQVIDPSIEGFGIDLFIDECLRLDSCKDILVKRYDKQDLGEATNKKLRLLNGFLREQGCGLFFSIDRDLGSGFEPSTELLDLLHKYWNKSAEFRDIRIYKNPDAGSEITDISQGQVVQTIIDEYNAARDGKEFRDVFLTAPTGAGKSLIFQLPAFYISSRGDVTIVISPLIALMKDQVNAISQNRGFSKVAYINSEISMNDRDSIIEKCKAGEIDVLYMAPELLISYDVSFFIGDRKIGLMVIDEAHLVTTWGRDFRVDYWYLGNHIRKIRKYKDQRFPMVAVTATAVYGGDNDMVFDTVDSLAMHAPHFFIGEVKRDDIEFIVNNYDSQSKGFDTFKIKQTAEYATKINELGFKALIYAPYTSHVNKIALKANENSDIAVKYYGTLSPLEKEQSETAFRTSAKKVMVCTKAFGMGVDIPDIQVVYHHAPSGILPDYIQEVGRAARDPKINGYALINYSERDQKYSKQLVGMSSIKLFQIKAILKKIYDTYVKNGFKRNMLLSVDDFAFAFDDDEDIEAKVKTGLMMIEKDYLAKFHYNVVIARPKSLFSIVYALIKKSDYTVFKNKYPGVSTILSDRQNGDIIILIHLDKMWKDNFSDISFPVLKAKYYQGHLLQDISISPRIRVSYNIANQQLAEIQINDFFSRMKNFFINHSVHFFTKDNLVDYLKGYYDDRTSRELAGYILEFADTSNSYAFLQEKMAVPRQYRLFSQLYEQAFSSLNKLYSSLSKDIDSKHNVSRYVAKDAITAFVRLGHLMEMLDCGNFEMAGGEAPMIFIRVNSPSLVKSDSCSTTYSNILFEKTRQKHEISSEIYNHFFMHSFSNKERWNFIEDFFLGHTNAELIDKYPGTPVHKVDVIDALKTKKVQKTNKSTKVSRGTSLLYPPQTKHSYSSSDHLSLDVNGEAVTLKIYQWINQYTMQLYDVCKAKTIYLCPDEYKSMMSVIQKNFPDEYNKILGLRKKIKIPGMKEPEIASLVMSKEPVKFYAWWRKDRNHVHMTLAEQIKFFDLLHTIDPSVIIESDRKKFFGPKK